MPSLTHPLQHSGKDITSDALEEHEGKVSLGGRNIINLRFPIDNESLAEEDQELEVLIGSLNKTCTRYKVNVFLRRPN